MPRGAKLAGLLALFAAGAALAFAGSAPQGLHSVDEVISHGAALEGERVDIKASVLEGSLVRGRDNTSLSFVATSGAASLDVRWDARMPIPEHEAGGTIEGRNIVVSGQVRRDPTTGTLYLWADDMQVGCASKYRPEDAPA